jgi:SPP1 gp7 family putative phage head morphogenesis protein
MIELVADVLRKVSGGWEVWSETAPSKRLAGPFPTREEAIRRLAAIEWFKTHGRRDAAELNANGREFAAHIRAQRLGAGDSRHPGTGRFVPGRSGNRFRGGRAGRKVLPAQPKAIEASYAARLVEVMDSSRRAYAPLLRELPDLMASARATRTADGLRADAGETGRARKLIEEAEASLGRTLDLSGIQRLAERIGMQTSAFNREQVVHVIRAAIGVEPILKDRKLANIVQGFAHENAALIKRIPRALHDDVATMTFRALNSGEHTATLTDAIENRFGVAERHARLIARDQVGRLSGQLTMVRHMDLGINRYVWETVGDERVRDEHAALQGQTFRYDDPPAEGNPGDPICCRCFSYPVLADVLNASSDDD